MRRLTGSRAHSCYLRLSTPCASSLSSCPPPLQFTPPTFSMPSMPKPALPIPVPVPGSPAPVPEGPSFFDQLREKQVRLLRLA